MIKVDVSNNLHGIEQDIREACEKSGRSPEEVKLIAVTKYVTIERAKEAVENGIKDLGENRPEGLLEKKNAIGDEATWHFIGTLQSRKVKEIIDVVDYIHSLDRMSLAKEINKRASRVIDCFVQVNTSGEESKHGLEPSEVSEFIDKLVDYPNIRVAGLMTMAPNIEDETELRNYFRKLKELRDEISNRHLSHAPCMFLSMGMSNDYKIAIEEGATHIRIGTKLVGAELKR
ncbi:YggS family pyridoxal phosphate-dependent enzyme [Aciduricibacillus chroicocephali]|uniref:Pyridoxal phosphate homeostasis protein n=1 Tax=Aciduricibacillus chroicocephali TaxID=3054939 RepID=A0ABY9KXW0_9BACI|nr:YggS family pyridoxal phosphate-dependent enzyme [Bacillaceae bacterium 44XB]